MVAPCVLWFAGTKCNFFILITATIYTAAIMVEQDNTYKLVKYVFQNFYLSQNIGFVMIFYGV
jgi:hypothetical protein